jgi:hypothetical protein
MYVWYIAAAAAAGVPTNKYIYKYKNTLIPPRKNRRHAIKTNPFGTRTFI